MKKFLEFCLGLAFLFAVFYAWALHRAAPEKAAAPADPAAGREGQICRTVQDDIQAQLKTKAEFASCTWHPEQVKYWRDGNYSFIMWVDADNLFGAKLHTRWFGAARVDPKANTFEITRLEHED